MSERMPVRVYIADIKPLMQEDCFKTYLRQVSAERREKVQKYRFLEDQARSLAAGLVRNAALREIGIDPAELQLVYGKNGKPLLAGRSDIFFNLSHSGARAMCAIGAGAVGCDVEQVQEKSSLNRIVMRYFTKKEQEQFLMCGSEQEKAETFFRIWTRKESYLKCTGSGLAESLSAFSVELGVSRIRENDTTYYFHEYAMGDAYRYCVCSTEASFEPEPRVVTFV